MIKKFTVFVQNEVSVLNKPASLIRHLFCFAAMVAMATADWRPIKFDSTNLSYDAQYIQLPGDKVAIEWHFICINRRYI